MKKYEDLNECQDPVVRLVAKVLFAHIIENRDRDILPITYKELSRLILERTGKEIDHIHGLDYPLWVISSTCKKNNLPLASAIVYNQERVIPGKGFFDTFFSHLPKEKWKEKFFECIDEVAKCEEWEEFYNEVFK